MEAVGGEILYGTDGSGGVVEMMTHWTRNKELEIETSMKRK